MKVGILGQGSIGCRHGRNADALGHEVIAYDPKYPQTNREQILSEVDAVLVCSPSECHLQDLKDCLAHGKPCLVEKPLALPRQLKEATELLSPNKSASFPAAKAKFEGLVREGADPDKLIVPHVPVAVGFNLRFHPAIKAIKAQLNDHKPYFGSFMCGQFTDSADVITNGVLCDWACHEIDLALHLIGPDLRVLDTHVTRFSADLRLTEWTTGARVFVHSDIHAAEWFRHTLVAAPECTFSVDLECDPVINEHYQDELRTFLLWVEERGPAPPPLATADDGLRQLKIAARADR